MSTINSSNSLGESLQGRRVDNKLSNEQKTKAQEILDKYDTSKLTEADHNSIKEAFKSAGIKPGEDLKNILESNGIKPGGPGKGPRGAGPGHPPPPRNGASSTGNLVNISA